MDDATARRAGPPKRPSPGWPGRPALPDPLPPEPERVLLNVAEVLRGQAAGQFGSGTFEGLPGVVADMCLIRWI